MIDVCDDGHVADVLHNALLNLAAKIVQIGRLAKQLVVFLLKYPIRCMWDTGGAAVKRLLKILPYLLVFIHILLYICSGL